MGIIIIERMEGLSKKISLKDVEWSILICVIVLTAIGCVALYSATQSTGNDELVKQLIWLGISIPVMIAFVVIDYEPITPQLKFEVAV